MTATQSRKTSFPEVTPPAPLAPQAVMLHFPKLFSVTNAALGTSGREERCIFYLPMVSAHIFDAWLKECINAADVQAMIAALERLEAAKINRQRWSSMERRASLSIAMQAGITLPLYASAADAQAALLSLPRKGMEVAL